MTNHVGTQKRDECRARQSASARLRCRSVLLAAFLPSLLLALFLGSALPTAPALAQQGLEPTLTTQEKLGLAESLEGAAQRALVTLLKGASGVGAGDVTVSLRWTWDEAGLARDLASRDPAAPSSSTEGRKLDRALLEEIRKLMAPDPGEPSSPTDDVMVVPEDGRMGPLNLDIMKGTKVRIFRNPGETDGRRQPFMLSVLLPLGDGGSASSAQGKRVAIDAGRYLKDVVADVTVPANVAKDLDARIEGAIRSTLSLHLPTATARAVKVQVQRAPAAPGSEKEKDAEESAGEEGKEEAPPAEKPTFLQELVNPKNPSLSALISAFPLSLAVLVCGLVLFFGAKNLASAVGKLQGETSKADKQGEGEGFLSRGAGGAQAGGADATTAGSQVLTAGTPTGGEARLTLKFDASSEADALTKEMGRLREQVEKASGEDPLALAEAASNLLYSPGGVELMREASAFVGQSIFDTIVDSLSRGQSMELAAVLLEKRNAAASLLAGAEGTKLFLSHWNMRRAETAPDFQGEGARTARALILKTDDAKLAPWLEEKRDSAEAAWVFRSLCTDRLLYLVSKLGAEAGGALLAGLDAPLEDSEILARSVIRELEPLAGVNAASPQRRLRVVRLLASNTTIDGEAILQRLLQGPDWDARLFILQRRYLFADVMHVRGKVLRSCLEAVRASERPSVAYLLPLEARSKLLEAYPETSKARELLTLELQLLDGNMKKQAQIRAAREKLLSEFMGHVRNALQAQPKELKAAMVSLARANGWEAPDGWEQEVLQEAESEVPLSTAAQSRAA